jgi:UDP-N-acetylenolpyruvoylglucosamine reductase
MLDFLEKNKNITQYSNFKTPAIAQYFFEISDISQLDQLKQVFDYISKNNVNYLVIS